MDTKPREKQKKKKTNNQTTKPQRQRKYPLISIMSTIYQSNGRPLSQQALYQQKLRQGVFNSPSKPSVGVNTNASDAAALLAASSDLSVKPSYERLQAAPEAHTAALAAKKGQITAWTRDAVDPHADAAAASAKLKPRAAGPASELGIPTYDKGSVYRQASQNSTYSISSRSAPQKNVSKHGLASSSTASSGFDISKVSRAADKNSSKLLNSRFNPEQDYRSGIPSKPAEFLTEDEEKLAAQSASRSLTFTHGSGYTDSVSSQKRTKTFQAHEVVDATLLAAASAAANERLKSINLTAPANLREQVQVYSKALAAAQKNSEARLKVRSEGLVDLGGGLSLPYAEINKLASLIVQPVLTDLETKAVAQRESDVAQAKLRNELLKKHRLSKEQEIARKQKEKKQREDEKLQRIQDNEAKKTAEDEKYAAYQEERNGEVRAKEEELAALQQQYQTEKEALLAEKQENEDRINEEETRLKAGRKEELDLMQAERDELLKPILEELAIESDKLKQLTDSKNALSSEVESSEKLGEEYEAKIAELKKKLEETNAEIELTTADLNATTAKRETTDKEVEELQASAAAKETSAEEEHKQLDEHMAALETEKQDNIATKAAHKKEILQHIDEKILDEKKINKELPEHLQTDVPEHRFRDVGSLFTVELKVNKPEKAAEKEIKPAAAPTAPIAQTSLAEENRKKGLRSRFSSIKKAFKAPAAAGGSATAATVAKPAVTKKEPVVTSSVKPELTHASSAPSIQNTEATNFDDDLSISQSNTGGVFKEEI